MTWKMLRGGLGALLAASCFAAPLATAQPAAGPTLAGVRARGVVTCGASGMAPGFGLADSRGELRGMDVDICRVVAAAVFGDPTRVRYVVQTAPQRIVSLQSGAVDLVAQSMTWTQTREANNGLEFTGTHFYDGQGFLVRRALGLNDATGLSGATICLPQGGRAEINAAEWGRAHRVQFTSLIFERTDEIISAYEAGRCDAISNDATLLMGIRSRLRVPNDHVLLADRISKEPLGTYVRKGDEQWLDIVKWTLHALINAEELGVTQANVEQMLTSQNPLVQRLLGVTGDHGRFMGLDNRWAFNVIRTMGNYGEIFERHFGEASATPTPRGLNRLWTQGGLMYGAPIQ
ncbi:amino acid ABC transporter substrate-binding protein [Roseococcus pinisoli]|nr:amino acid ABC transporter substrate-binding protein [Roseococcus pinisoli]